MRVCFSCVAAHGHVEPLLPLACALRDAGHSAEAAPLVATLWHSVGLAPAPLCGLTRTLYIDLCPPSLRDEPFPDVPLAPLRPVSVGRHPAARDRRRTIYVTLGTVFNDPAVMRVLLAGVSTDDWDVIATVGADRDPTELGPQPANVHVRRYVAQSRVLPHCAAVVSHGGCGTMLGALAHGLPLLIVPQGADQFENAQRCEAAGVGRGLAPERLSAAAVREQLHALLADHEYARSAQRVATEIAAMPPPESVVASVVGLT